jgi:hypothetical protein
VLAAHPGAIAIAAAQREGLRLLLARVDQALGSTRPRNLAIGP